MQETSSFISVTRHDGNVLVMVKNFNIFSIIWQKGGLKIGKRHSMGDCVQGKRIERKKGQ